MSGNIQLKPGGLMARQAKAGIVVAGLFLLFGLVFAWVVLGESASSEPGMSLLVGAFFLIWVVVCLVLIASFARVLRAGAGSSPGSLGEAVVEGAASDFETRLRGLESLRREGLITEEEYRGKRSQILGEKW